MNSLFGRQLTYVGDVLEAKRQPVNAGISPSEAQQRATLAGQYSRVIMQIVVSCGVLAACLYILLHGAQEPVQKAAFGFIGTVLGYWLR
jgi:hypothetical protein